MPMAPVSGTSRGLEWPIDGLALSPTGRIGTSNRACAAEVEIATDGPGLLCLLEPSAFPNVLDALFSAHDL